MDGCLLHPSRESISRCSVCDGAVCDLCLGEIDRTAYCPEHFTEAEARLQAAAYGIAPPPEAIGISESLIGIWALLGAVAPWLTWYRTLVRVPVPGRTEALINVVNETGWEAGGLAALACVALVASGVALVVMVGVRFVRRGVLSRAAIAHAAVSLGATVTGLLLLQGIVRAAAGRSLDAESGLYVAATSGIICVYLGRRAGSVSREPAPPIR